MKFFLFFLIILPLGCFSQHKQMLPLDLKKHIKTFQADEQIDLYLRGDLASLTTFVRAENGKIKGTLSNILACSLPASKMALLNELEELNYIEYSGSEPHMLNDIMLTNNNVVPVHFGSLPLPQAFLGDDVILGFIDSGIELTHPDFQNVDGFTRVIALWDQTQEETIPFRVPQPYGYGQEWNAEDIDSDITNHEDQASFFGHGSSVAGVGAGNGNATGNFVGVAPNADIIAVSSDFNRPNWSSSVADAVDFIFAKAEALGKPAVVNISLGDYFGSHDGLDAPTLFIDELLEEEGRAVVAAAGNSGNLGNYHLSYDIPEVDTAFTWFKYNSSAQAVFFELWSDTIDFNETFYTIGADLTIPQYEFRGYASWRNASDNLNTIITDTIFYQGTVLGIVHTWCGLRGGQYHLQVEITQPFSNQYLWRFATTGGGKFDCWSYAPFGTSQIMEVGLPNGGSFPDMQYYEFPDNHKTIVNSWVCSEKVITVGNYVNRDSFTNYLGEQTTFGDVPGEISINCSRGPTRDMRQKPDIAASGDHTLSAGRIATLNSWINIEPHKVAEDGMHYINGGTSLASPVVAGVAALYFSRDPDATYLDIKNAVLNNALADQFTGILPGNQFGYGKVDAFASLTLPFATSYAKGGLSKKALEIYPNPTTGIFYAKATEYEVTSISIYDVTGRLMMQSSSEIKPQSEFTISLSDFANGIYFVHSQTYSGFAGIVKLIVEK